MTRLRAALSRAGALTPPDPDTFNPGVTSQPWTSMKSGKCELVYREMNPHSILPRAFYVLRFSGKHLTCRTQNESSA